MSLKKLLLIFAFALVSIQGYSTHLQGGEIVWKCKPNGKYQFTLVTDSGGITEETTVMGVPCLTLRDNTERPETITVGTNELIGTDPKNIAPAMKTLFAGEWKTGGIPELWDGRTAGRIVEKLIEL